MIHWFLKIDTGEARVKDSYDIKKLTDCRWINLFEVLYSRKTGKDRTWLMCSRKERPVADAAKSDIVLIIATINSGGKEKLVVTKEFRVPVWDYEYGFPTGLIDEGETIEEAAKREMKEETGLDVVKIDHISMPVYSSAGLTDESGHMVIARVEGEVSDKWLDDGEDIETLLLDAEEIKELLRSNKKIAAKAWTTLYHYAKTGKI